MIKGSLRQDLQVGKLLLLLIVVHFYAGSDHVANYFLNRAQNHLQIQREYPCTDTLADAYAITYTTEPVYSYIVFSCDEATL